jgi:hypothetical protein
MQFIYDFLINRIFSSPLPYNLSYKIVVLYPVPRPGDMIGRGLVCKTGLIKSCGALISPFFFDAIRTFLTITDLPLYPLPKSPTMAPIPRLRHGEPLAPGQTTIFGALNGSLSLARAAPPPRQGPKQKTNGQSDTVLGRRLVGGQNGKQVIETFANARSQLNLAEPGDEDIVQGVINDDLDDTEGDYIPVHKRHAYAREHKLVAIDYYKTTWRENKDGTFEHLSCRYAAKRLKITRKMLRSWVSNKEKIIAQPRGTFRSRRQYAPPKEPVLEDELDIEFIYYYSLFRPV